MNVALLYVTSGRTKYLERCVESLQACVPYDWCNVVLSDDSATPADLDAAVRITGADVVNSHARKVGGAGNIDSAWRCINHLGEVDYVFHVEEDWLFLQPVDIDEMIGVLEDDPWLANLVLRRQPWGGEGPGGYIGDDPAGFTDQGGWLRHTKGFWLNPCLYPIRVTFGGWPKGGHEHHFSARVLSEGYHFGVLGGHDDAPRVWHIGDERAASWTW